MSKRASLIFQLILLTVVAHQSQCQESFWQKFRTKLNWGPPKDPLACYKTVTLQLFENLKKIIDVIYVEIGEKEFKSKVKLRSNLFSFFHKGDETNEVSLKKRIQEAEQIAYHGIFTIRNWLQYHCTDERQTQIMEFTKSFKEAIPKCGDSEYLSFSILCLEQTCPEKDKEGIANGRPTFNWKSQIHGLSDPWTFEQNN